MILSGRHQDGYSNKDVAYVCFTNCKITKVPQGLMKIFPKLEILYIESSQLKKITKDDLAEYRNLREFFCTRNEVEFLPGDLFEGFKNLERICFMRNRLKLIEPNILDGLERLKAVSFILNPKYNICYSTIPLVYSNASLEEIKEELSRKQEWRLVN